MKRQGNVIINDGLLINSGPGFIGAKGKIVNDHFDHRNLQKKSHWQSG